MVLFSSAKPEHWATMYSMSDAIQMCASIQSKALKIRAIVQLKFKSNVPVFADTAFAVNSAYVASIGIYLYILIN